jgi:hypothetical protein
MAAKNKGIYVAAAPAVLLVPLGLFLHTFSPSPYDAETLRGAAARCDTAKGDIRLLFGGWREPSSCGLRLSWGLVFERRDFSMAGALVKHPKGDLLIDTGFGRDIDKQFRTPALDRPCYHVLQSVAARGRPTKGRWLRPEIAPRHSIDPFALGSRQRPARFSGRAGVGYAAGTRVHQRKWRHGFLQTLHRHTL